MNVQEIKLLLEKYKLAPLKSRGQHFLINAQAVQHIVRVANIEPYDTILEIGPGLGMLTKELIGKAGKVYAIDIDKGFITALKNEFTYAANLTLIHGDVLRLKTSSYIHDGTYKFVGNLPYNITSLILEKFLKTSPKPESVTVTVQRELAQRITVKPPHMNRLALFCQYYGNVSRSASFPPHYFWPQPQVHSSLIHIQLYPESQLPLSKNQETALWNAIKLSFNQPRKTLKSSLHLSYTAYETKRPGELSLKEWVNIITLRLKK